jgi:hypothetical protein
MPVPVAFKLAKGPRELTYPEGSASATRCQPEWAVLAGDSDIEALLTRSQPQSGCYQDDSDGRTVNSESESESESILGQLARWRERYSNCNLTSESASGPGPRLRGHHASWERQIPMENSLLIYLFPLLVTVRPARPGRGPGPLRRRPGRRNLKFLAIIGYYCTMLKH